MKHLTIYICIIFSLLTSNAIGQEDSLIMKTKGFYLGFNGSYNQNSLKHTINGVGDYQYSDYTETSADLSFGGTFELGYLITPHFGISLGAEYQTFQLKSDIVGFTESYEAIDDDFQSGPETYTRLAEVHHFTDNQTIGLIQIPFSIQLRVPFSSNFHFYIKPGIAAGIPIEKTSKGMGNVTFKGDYPYLSEPLENIPHHGFPTQEDIKTESDMEVSDLILLGSIQAGFDINLGKKTILTLGARYSQSLNEVMDTESTHLTTVNGDKYAVNSISVLSKETKLQGFGAFIGLKFFPFNASYKSSPSYVPPASMR